MVLPNGQFAAVRTILVSDIGAYCAAAPEVAMATLAARVATLDDNPVTGAQIMAMPYADALPIFTAINRQLAAAFQTRSGVA